MLIRKKYYFSREKMINKRNRVIYTIHLHYKVTITEYILRRFIIQSIVKIKLYLQHFFISHQPVEEVILNCTQPFYLSTSNKISIERTRNLKHTSNVHRV